MGLLASVPALKDVSDIFWIKWDFKLLALV